MPRNCPYCDHPDQLLEPYQWVRDGHYAADWIVECCRCSASTLPDPDDEEVWKAWETAVYPNQDLFRVATAQKPLGDPR